jgi:hypothetical protein
VRAAWYLAGEQAALAASAGQTRGYNGIVPVFCDGAIQQVTWEIGPAGASTKASLNSEHAAYIPKFPERRRREVDLLAVREDAGRLARQARVLRVQRVLAAGENT